MNKTIKKVIGTVALGFLLVGCSTEDQAPVEEEPLDTIEWSDQMGSEEYKELVESKTGSEGNQKEIADLGPAVEFEKFRALRVQDIQNIQEEKLTGIVYWGYDECPYCITLRQKLEPVLEDLDQDIYYADREAWADLTEEEAMSMLNKYEIEYVPSVIVYEEGEEVARMDEDIDGDASYLTILGWMRNHLQEIK